MPTLTREVGDAPSQHEGGSKVVGVAAQRGLEGVVQPEVQAAVHDDADARDDEAAVQAGNTVCAAG